MLAGAAGAIGSKGGMLKLPSAPPLGAGRLGRREGMLALVSEMCCGVDSRELVELGSCGKAPMYAKV